MSSRAWRQKVVVHVDLPCGCTSRADRDAGVCRGGQAPRGVGEEPEMIALLIALAIASVAFWRVAFKILVIVTVFLLVCGIVQVIQDLHHIK